MKNTKTKKTKSIKAVAIVLCSISIISLLLLIGCKVETESRIDFAYAEQIVDVTITELSFEITPVEAENLFELFKDKIYTFYGDDYGEMYDIYSGKIIAARDDAINRFYANSSKITILEYEINNDMRIKEYSKLSNVLITQLNNKKMTYDISEYNQLIFSIFEFITGSGNMYWTYFSNFDPSLVPGRTPFYASTILVNGITYYPTTPTADLSVMRDERIVVRYVPLAF